MEEAGKEMPNQKDYDVVTASEKPTDQVFNLIEKEISDTENPLETVRKQLEAAIEEERYEDAARLRDEIRKLEE